MSVIAVAEPRCRWDQRHQGGTGAAQVFVRSIYHRLCIRHIVNGGDDAVANAEALLNDLHHRRKAIRRAGCRRHDVMDCGIVEMVVHSHNDVQGTALLDGSGDDDLLHALRKVGIQGYRV